MAPHAAKSVTVQGELLANEVAVQLRTMLGGSASVAPNGPTTLLGSAVPAELRIVAHRDGSMVWHAFSPSGDTSALVLLSAALDSARHHGEALMIWSDDYAADSIDFRLSLLPEHFGAAAGIDSTYKSEMRFGAFSILELKELPALPVKGSAYIVYPHTTMRSESVTGQVIAEFVVDTAGRAEMSTFRDVWPPNKARLTGSLGRYYDDFLSAIRDYAAKAKFTPASIGGCNIPQLVRMPVSFRGPHSQRPYAPPQ